MSGKPSQRRPLPAPADVLAGRVLADAETLVALIRDCNPTGRDLPAEERRRRYVRKARLQSLLVRRFAAEIAVAREPGRHTVVLLEHRGRSAGHAPLDALDEDARAWVQRRLDESAAPAPVPAATHDRPLRAPRPAAQPARAARRRTAAPLPADPLRAGEAALHAFDYDSARACLRRALDEATPERRVPAARALLALLVDTLGDDGAAIGLDGALPEEAQADAEVRGLLAEASARAGSPARAAALVAGQSSRRAVTVHLLLFDQALRGGDLPSAEAALERAGGLDPAEPGVAERTERLRQARAAERQPLEAEIQRLVAAGADTEAEAAARALLRRWPGSVAAKAALASVDARRRSGEAEALLREAEAALREGRPAAAIGPLSEALRRTASSPLRDRLRALLTEADHAQQRERAAARQAAVLGHLAGQEPGPGLIGYLGLGPEAQEAVRAEAAPGALRLLGWLDEMHRARPDAPPRTLAEAARALGGADIEAEADPEAALLRLRGHERALGPVGRYQRLAAAAHERQRARRQSEARARIGAVRAAQAGGAVEELVRAQALLAGTELHLLGEDERCEAETLLAALEAQRERHDQEVRFRHLRAAGDLGSLLGARDLAGRLAAAHGGESAARWQAAETTIQRELRRAFRVRTSDEPASQADIDALACHAAEACGGRWLVPGHDEVLVLTVIGRRLFLHRVGFDGGVRSQVRLVTPDPVSLLTDDFDEGGLWVYGTNGMLLRLSLPEFDVLRYHPPGELLRPGETVAFAQLTEGSRFLWLGVERDTGHGQDVRVLDLLRPRSALRLGALPFARALTGAEADPVAGLVVGGTEPADAVTLFDPAGHPLRRVPLPCPAELRAAAPHPAGGLLLVVAPLDRPGALACVSVPPTGAAGPLQPVDGASARGLCQLALDPAAGLAFLRCAADEGDLLVALRGAGAGGVEEAYRAPLPGGSVLVRDGASPRVVLAWTATRSMRLARLGATPPTIEAAATRRATTLLTMGNCWPDLRFPPDWPMARFARGLSRARPAERVSGILENLRAQPAEPWAAVQLDSFLAQHGFLVEATVFAREALKTHDSAGLRLVVANYEARLEGWAEARRLLAEVGAELGNGSAERVGGPARVRHLQHLRALALLDAGDHTGAEAALRAGLEHEGACPLEGLLELVTLLRDPGATGPADPGPELALALAARAADRCLDRDDAAGACAALEVPVVWQEDEVQTFARLAWARLRLPSPAEESDRFHMALTMASYLHAHRGEPRSELPLPERWDRRRLDEVAAQAEAWLEADEADADLGPDAAS